MDTSDLLPAGYVRYNGRILYFGHGLGERKSSATVDVSRNAFAPAGVVRTKKTTTMAAAGVGKRLSAAGTGDVVVGHGPSDSGSPVNPRKKKLRIAGGLYTTGSSPLASRGENCNGGGGGDNIMEEPRRKVARVGRLPHHPSAEDDATAATYVRSPQASNHDGDTTRHLMEAMACRDAPKRALAKARAVSRDELEAKKAARVCGKSTRVDERNQPAVDKRALKRKDNSVKERKFSSKSEASLTSFMSTHARGENDEEPFQQEEADDFGPNAPVQSDEAQANEGVVVPEASDGTAAVGVDEDQSFLDPGLRADPRLVKISIRSALPTDHSATVSPASKRDANAETKSAMPNKDELLMLRDDLSAVKGELVQARDRIFLLEGDLQHADDHDLRELAFEKELNARLAARSEEQEGEISELKRQLADYTWLQGSCSA